jgi:hypothetical protein
MTDDPGTPDNDTADEDRARDSLHLLPLSMLPLRVEGLKRARLVRNQRLETTVEMFKAVGSGQVAIAALPSLFVNDEEAIAEDVRTLNKLAGLGSFDVYSLRLELRRLGVPVEDHAKLTLSPRKRAELNDHLKSFTEPLIVSVYGHGDAMVGATNVIDLIARPNRAEAMRNIQMLAEKLRVDMAEIPAFLEDYGEIFLSLAYFQTVFERLAQDAVGFGQWVDELKDSYLAKGDAPVLAVLDNVTETTGQIVASLHGRFRSFKLSAEDFWNEISADRFREVRALILANHVSIATVLCGLTLKIDAWRERFPGGGGGPQRRLDFIRSEFMPGLAQIRAVEAEAKAKT